MEWNINNSTIEEGIRLTEKYLIDNKVNFVKVHVIGNHILQDLIPYGFIPAVINNNSASSIRVQSLFEQFVLKNDAKTRRFWLSGRATDYGSIHDWNIEQHHYHYFYATIEGWMDYAKRTSIVMPIFLFAPNKLYASGNLKTDMAMFQQVTSSKYSSVKQETPITFQVTVGEKVLLGVPVIRHAVEPFKGLFYDQSDETYLKNSFCGTFYYREKESNVYLLYEKGMKFKNKYEAAKVLLGVPDARAIRPKIARNYYENLESFPYPDLMMTPREYFYHIRDDEMLQEMLADIQDDHVKQLNTSDLFDLYNNPVPDEKYYVGAVLQIAGVDEVYDQDLCIVAALKGIDVLVFYEMVGSHKFQIEVLDCRDRITSFDNLSYPL
jgi:hypothetical protein